MNIKSKEEYSYCFEYESAWWWFLEQIKDVPCFD